MVSKIFFFVFVTLSVVALSESLQCYKCSGKVGSDCAKGVVSAMTVETCPSKSTFCYSLDLTGAWTGRSVSRDCESFGPKCETLKHVQDIGVTACEECKDNLCNTLALGL